tara:strand:- start:2049 stop:2762 length:714 start_codon:yes stop_codon:yes gene_type:complete
MYFDHPMNDMPQTVAGINYGRSVADLHGLTMRSLSLGETWWNEELQCWQAVCRRCGGGGVLTEKWAVKDQHHRDTEGQPVETVKTADGREGMRCFACDGETKDGIYRAFPWALPMPQHYMQACLMTCLRLIKAKRTIEIEHIAKKEIDWALKNQWGYQKQMWEFWKFIGRRYDRKVKTNFFLTTDDLLIPWIHQATMGHERNGMAISKMVLNGWDYRTAKFLLGCFSDLQDKANGNA